MTAPLFFVGLHQPSNAREFERCMVSINRIRDRQSDFVVRDWIMDSGAFTELERHGCYREEPEVYAAHVNRWRSCGNLLAAVSQDYMCEPFMLARTGLTVADHQRLTIERYDRIRAAVHADTHIMPVLQGWTAADYVRHVRAYGDRLAPGMWVGVGSVCKRNSRPAVVELILRAIKAERPDLRLHGFGLKITALAWDGVRSRLYSADSMAWSQHERKQGRDANNPAAAHRYVEKVRRQRMSIDEQLDGLPIWMAA